MTCAMGMPMQSHDQLHCANNLNTHTLVLTLTLTLTLTSINLRIGWLIRSFRT